MANRWGNSGNIGWLYIWGLQSHCRSWLKPWNQKVLAPWKKNYDQSWQHIKKQKHYFANKGPYSHDYVFPVVLCGCESWTTTKAVCLRIHAFELWCWMRLLDWRRSNQSILMEINPEYSLEGLMLELKRQYFGHLMPRTDSLEKTLMLGKIEGTGGRRRQRADVGWPHWLNGHSFSKLWEMLKYGKAWSVAVHGVRKSQTLLSDWTAITNLMTSSVSNLKSISSIWCDNNRAVCQPEVSCMFVQTRPCPEAFWWSPTKASFSIEAGWVLFWLGLQGGRGDLLSLRRELFTVLTQTLYMPRWFCP